MGWFGAGRGFGGRRVGGEMNRRLRQWGGGRQGEGKLGRRGFEFGCAGGEQGEQEDNWENAENPPGEFHARDYTPEARAGCLLLSVP